jgi:cytochrome c oxidase subunit 3
LAEAHALAAGVGTETAHHFATEEQHRRAAMLGMWAFLLTELLLFSGLFLAALVLRVLHPGAVQAAAKHLNMWIGGANSVVLILSSLTMSAAIELSKLGRQRDMVRCLVATAGFGVLFLVFKSYEYYGDYAEHLTPFLSRPYAIAGDGPSILFVDLYYIITSLHAVHLTIGIGIVLVTARLASGPGYLGRHQNRIEITGLYWHFIDVMWIIVYPTLYLVNR